MSDKPREMYGNFTGGELDDGSCQIWEMHFSPYSEEDIKDGKGTEFEPVHWIEKSAFDQLREENERLKQTVTSYEDERYPFSAGDMVRENQKLKYLCDEMARVFERICSVVGTSTEAWHFSNKILIKYREMMGEK